MRTTPPRSAGGILLYGKLSRLPTPSASSALGASPRLGTPPPPRPRLAPSPKPVDPGPGVTLRSQPLPLALRSPR